MSNLSLRMQLQDVVDVPKKEVEVNGRPVSFMGTLSDTFAAALNNALARDESDSVPVVESFTDPEVIAQYVAERVKHSTSKKPLMLYGVRTDEIDESTIAKAAVTCVDNRDYEFIMVYDHSGNQSIKRDLHSPRNRMVMTLYQDGLSQIIKGLGGEVASTPDEFNTAMESYENYGS